MSSFDDIDIFGYNLGGSVSTMMGRTPEPKLPELTPAQLANIGAAFADPLGMVDITGEYPEFPAAGVSTAEMVMQGPRSPSLMENLREGDYGAAALQGVGVIPVVGGAARAIRGVAKGADRLAKAQKAGFDTDTVYYHGADADITEFRMPSRETGQTKTVGTGVFMSSSPEVASSYAKSLDDAAVYPVYINKQEFLKVRPAEKGNFWSRIPTDGLVVEFPDGSTKPATDVFKLEPGETDTDELSRIARSQGRKGLIVEGVVDAGVGGAGEYRYATQYLRDKGYDVSLPIGTTKESFDKMNAVPPEIMKEARLYAKAQLYRPADVVVSFDPKNIRSVNAEFEDLDSPELLKAEGGAIDVKEIDIFEPTQFKFGGAVKALDAPKKAPKNSLEVAEKLVRSGVPAKQAAMAASAALLIGSPEDSEAARFDLSLKLFREKNDEPLELKPTFVRGERKTAKRVSISDAEKDVLQDSADAFNAKQKSGGKQVSVSEALAAYKDWKRRHPPADWVQPELTGFSVNKKGSIKFEFKSPMYAYNKSKTTGKPIEVGSAEYNRLRRNVSDEIIDYLDRAITDPDDAAAQNVLSNAGWYKNVERRLGTEYGSFKEMMGDLLGATSPNTPVGTNFNFSKKILSAFSRGDFDELMDGFADRLQRKYDLEDAADQYVQEQVAAGRTQTSAKTDETYRSLLDEAKKISSDLQDNRNTIKQPGTESAENPLGKNFGINSYNAMLALADQFRVRRKGSAPKAKNFAGNLVGTSKEATIDVWAARNLRRNTGRKAIPSSAEQGVTGTVVDVDNFRSSQEFGFGQDVLRDVTADINARFGADSPIGELDPRDVQALQWFIEKDIWTQNGWTSKTGEGGSFEQMLDADPVESVFLGLSREQSERFQGRDFVPTDEESLEAGQRILDPVATDPDVVTFKALPTRGAYMGDPETALDVEVVVRQDMYSPELFTEAARQAVEDGQHSWFVARRIDDRLGRAQPEAFQVGTEIYFDSAKAADDELIDDLQAYLINNGIPAYTLIKDARDATKVLGMRVLDIPQFYEPQKFAQMSTKMYKNHVTQEFDRLTDLGRDLTEEFGQVKSAEPGYFDVNVKTLEQSKEYLRELAERPEESDRIAKAFFGFQEAPRRFQQFAGSSAPYYLRRRKADKADRTKNRATLSGIGALAAGLGAMQEARAATLQAEAAPFEVGLDFATSIVGPMAGGIAGIAEFTQGLPRRIIGDLTGEESAARIDATNELVKEALNYEPTSELGREMSQKAQEGIASLLEPVVEDARTEFPKLLDYIRAEEQKYTPLGMLYRGGKFAYEDLFGEAEREALKSAMDVAL
jgi:hypothetical protein